MTFRPFQRHAAGFKFLAVIVLGLGVLSMGAAPAAKQAIRILSPAKPAASSRAIPLPLLQAAQLAGMPIAQAAHCVSLSKAVSSGVSRMTMLNLRILVGQGGTHYQYKFGPAAQTNPASADGYSAPISSSKRLIQDLSGCPDGEVVLCVRGLRIVNGALAAQQPFPYATVYRWVKRQSSGAGGRCGEQAGLLLAPGFGCKGKDPGRFGQRIPGVLQSRLFGH